MFRPILFTLLLAATGAATAAGNDDPLEAINRPLFVFNDTLDRTILRPVAQGYDYVFPRPVKTGVSNFFSNLFDINRTVNSLLQGRLDGAGRSAARFVVNSSLGMFGLFDVATDMGLTLNRADFGQTLAAWGAPEGPYVMVPLLGPRTLRSGMGTLVDTVASVPGQVDNVPVRNTLFFTGIVNERALLLDADKLLSGDRYIFLRDAYLQQRRSFIGNGEVQDDFSDYEDDWEEEF